MSSSAPRSAQQYCLNVVPIVLFVFVFSLGSDYSDANQAGSEEKEAGGKKPGHKESSEEKGAAIKKGRKDI